MSSSHLKLEKLGSRWKHQDQEVQRAGMMRTCVTRRVLWLMSNCDGSSALKGTNLTHPLNNSGQAAVDELHFPQSPLGTMVEVASAPWMSCHERCGNHQSCGDGLPANTKSSTSYDIEPDQAQCMAAEAIRKVIQLN